MEVESLVQKVEISTKKKLMDSLVKRDSMKSAKEQQNLKIAL